MEQENEKKEDSNPAKVATKAQSEASNAAETATGALSSENKTQKSLKARSKIAKKSPVNDTKSKNANVTRAARRRIRRKKNKNVLDGKIGSGSSQREDSKKLNSREEDQKEDVTNRKDVDKNKHTQKNEDEIGGSNTGQEEHIREDKSLRDKKDEEKHGGTENNKSDKSLRNQKNKERLSDVAKTGVSDRSSRDKKNEEKPSNTGKSEEMEKKKEKLGGLIFMCSKKTKPDCFHYRVMGVSASKKEFVLGIKPGLKLFLYDYDLKLMYGIYKASSSGGMKLEPKAFDGAFPAQVRFNVHVDCLPLHESVFKKAIKENYNEKNKFKFELTPKQVGKLSVLFRPASVRSTALHVCSPPMPKVQDREVYAGVRESDRETFARDSYVNACSRSYSRPSHERDQHFACAKVGSALREERPSHERDQHFAYAKVGSALREEHSRGLYLTEKEYRSYGLQGDRRNLTSTYHIAPLDPYERLHEREHPHHLRHPDPVYRNKIPASRESVPADPLYLNERDYRAYNIGARHELRSAVSPAAAPITAATTASTATLDSYGRDPYKTYYCGASVDPYLPPPRRQDIASSSYLVDGRRDSCLVDGRRDSYLVGTGLLRRETNPVDRLYSTYAADALSNYNQQHHYEVAKPESVAAPVSSRYSFAGPSLSYR